MQCSLFRQRKKMNKSVEQRKKECRSLESAATRKRIETRGGISIGDLAIMAKKNDRPTGIERLMTAAADLSNLAMATTATAAPPAILKPSAASKWPNDPSAIDKYNWLLHIMYGRGEYDRIQQFIRLQTQKNSYMTYVQALVLRQEGRIAEALDLFQRCVVENPSLINIKQVAKTLALLGRYRVAIDAYKEALTRTSNDWEIFHNLGLCYMQLREFTEAKQYLSQALQISEIQEASYLALGKVHLLEGSREEAETVFERGARRNPESPTLFTQMGLLAFEVTMRSACQYASNFTLF
jgi:tetratricopeptide (TPR) repeat protein